MKQKKKKSREQEKKKNVDSSKERKIIGTTNSSKSRQYSESERLNLSNPRNNEYYRNYSKYTSINNQVKHTSTKVIHFLCNIKKMLKKKTTKFQSKLDDILNKSSGRSNSHTKMMLENYVSPTNFNNPKFSKQYYSDFFLLKERYGPTFLSKFCKFFI